jgi:hypothetical protein
MKKQIVTAIAIGITGTFPALAQESPEDQHTQEESQGNPQTALRNLALMGSGAVEKKVENGRLKSLRIVGFCEIPNSMSIGRGRKFAQGKAFMDAQNQFIKWMENNVSSITQSGDEDIVMIDNGEDSSKGSSTFKEEIRSEAQGLIRGLNIIHVEVDSEDRILYVVAGWSSQNADFARQAQAQNNKQGDSGAPAAGSLKSEQGKKKTLKDISISSGDADEY